MSIFAEIIIVPVKSSGGSQLSVPDMKTPSGRSHHHHHHHHRRSFSHHHGHHHRYYGVRHHHHQHQSPAYRWTNKLIRSDLTASRRLKSIRTRQEATERGLVRNVSDASRANQRTPYNHRGWLYWRIFSLSPFTDLGMYKATNIHPNYLT